MKSNIFSEISECDRIWFDLREASSSSYPSLSPRPYAELSMPPIALLFLWLWNLSAWATSFNSAELSWITPSDYELFWSGYWTSNILFGLFTRFGKRGDVTNSLSTNRRFVLGCSCSATVVVSGLKCVTFVFWNRSLAIYSSVGAGHAAKSFASLAEICVPTFASNCNYPFAGKPINADDRVRISSGPFVYPGTPVLKLESDMCLSTS